MFFRSKYANNNHTLVTQTVFLFMDYDYLTNTGGLLLLKYPILSDSELHDDTIASIWMTQKDSLMKWKNLLSMLKYLNLGKKNLLMNYLILTFQLKKIEEEKKNIEKSYTFVSKLGRNPISF